MYVDAQICTVLLSFQVNIFFMFQGTFNNEVETILSFYLPLGGHF